MPPDAPLDPRTIERIFTAEYGRAVAVLVRHLGDIRQKLGRGVGRRQMVRSACFAV